MAIRAHLAPVTVTTVIAALAPVIITFLTFLPAIFADYRAVLTQITGTALRFVITLQA
ncbi:MAG: hypothetical protein J5943_01485 [Oribacterium sp.]|nr:hypothetical protein [Oribacterium sp.]